MHEELGEKWVEDIMHFPIFFAWDPNPPWKLGGKLSWTFLF